jgi:hypothetical protein
VSEGLTKSHLTNPEENSDEKAKQLLPKQFNEGEHQINGRKGRAADCW